MNAQLKLPLAMNQIPCAAWLLAAMMISGGVSAVEVATNPLIPAPVESGMLLSASSAAPSAAPLMVSPTIMPSTANSGLMTPPAASNTNPLVPMTAVPDKTLKLPVVQARKNNVATNSGAANVKSNAVVNRKDPVRAMQDEMPSLDDGVNQHVVWNKVPITVSLRVGQERRITLPARMRIAVPPDLSRKLALLLVDDTAYVTATAPFEKIRLIAEDPVRGMVLLMDVSASKNNGAVAPITIHLPNANANSNARDETAARNSNNASEEAAAPDYVALTRFAAKQIYAPRRLAADLPGVATVGYPSVSIKGLYRLGNLDARAIGAWRSESHYVTAIKLTNLGVAPLELDPREVRGAWVTITFQHGRLLSKGDEADTTVMYLVSDAPFESSL
jgi:integrating conjugative element protein (TIGR03749 family)